MRLTIPEKKIDFLKQNLNAWKDTNGLRDYPWRHTNNPFQILITEILLRRTKSEKVAEIWDDFFSKYKDFYDILEHQNQIREDLYSLGLINRRMNTLIDLAKELKGKSIPVEEDQLLELKGIGKYIARILIVMINDEKKYVFDSNFRRLYSRFFGIDLLVDLKRDKKIEPLSELVLPEEKPREFILTVLDFSAMVCKPRSPNCNECPLSSKCYYFKNK